MVTKNVLTIEEASLLLRVSKSTLRRWDNEDRLIAHKYPGSNRRYYKYSDVVEFMGSLFEDPIDEKRERPKPKRTYAAIELFAGAGGLAVGLERAGIKCKALSEIDKWACQTLRHNRPDWNVLEGDVTNQSFDHFKGSIDIVTGGFPCQAFSYAGKKLGFDDARGTLFYEFARVVKSVEPLICIGENVRGLISHDNGRTLEGMISVLDEIGYNVLPVKVLNAVNFRVPQKRERLILVGIKKGIKAEFNYPKPYDKTYNLKDAFFKGSLFETDVPLSVGVEYPEWKREVMKLVPEKGYWRDLPLEIQKEYMGRSFYLGGGKTGMARRIGWDEPSLTLTCNPAQKQTERCHPSETRPFTVREYARIQTFPDEWSFCGSKTQQYKQIGNAVPVNLAEEIGYEIISFLNQCN